VTNRWISVNSSFPAPLKDDRDLVAARACKWPQSPATGKGRSWWESSLSSIHWTHLDARVDLQEEVVAVLVHHEFDRAGVAVADVLAQRHGIAVQRRAHRWVQAVRWRYLHHLRAPRQALPQQKIFLYRWG
jgi:hypothetical protein